jgi:HAD superfamily hydrolase (TIGR01509 family)
LVSALKAVGLLVALCLYAEEIKPACMSAMLSMMHAGLVLDFDGTILDTEGPNYRSWAELWDDQGHQLELADWQQIIGTDGVFDPWDELERRVGGPLDPILGLRRQSRRDQLLKQEEVRPGIVAWLGEAEELGIPVGIASSSPNDWVEAHLESIGLRPRFACVVGRDERVPAKPDPSSYVLACQVLGADPTRSVAVEDSPHGVSAAVAAGLFTVVVPHQWTAGLDVSTADLVVSSLEVLTLSDVLGRAAERTTKEP